MPIVRSEYDFRITPAETNGFARERKAQMVSDKEPTQEGLIELSQHLPESDRRVELAGGVYDIYWAKSSDESNFRDRTLEEITEAARWSYRKYYGPNIPLLDEADTVSDIYVVKFTSTEDLKRSGDFGENSLQTEFTQFSSLRFVPIGTYPDVNEDFDYYVHNDGRKEIPIWKFVREKYAELSDEEFEKSGVTLSRFCPVRPFPTRYLGGNSMSLVREAASFKKRNDLLGLPFALMNEQFHLDHKDKDIRFVTCQMHEELSNGILSYPPGSGDIVMPFTIASDHFGVPRNSIYVNRKHAPIAYEVPGYFLDRHVLVARIDELINAGNLPPLETISGLLPSGVSWEKIKTNPSLGHFVNFGPKLLARIGEIQQGYMTAESLREDLSRNVPDGARWRFMDAQDVWWPGIRNFIKKIDTRYRDTTAQQRIHGDVIFARDNKVLSVASD